MLLKERLVERRKAVGLSQEQFSRAIGVSVAKVRRWEHDGPPPRVPEFRLICQVLDTNFFYLTGHGEYHPFLGPLTAVEAGLIQDYRQLTGAAKQRCVGCRSASKKVAAVVRAAESLDAILDPPS